MKKHIKNILYPVVSGVLTVFLIWVASQIIMVKVSQAVMAEQIKNICQDVKYTREWMDKIRLQAGPGSDKSIQIVLKGKP